MYELTHFSLVFSRLNSLTYSSCFSHLVSLFSSSALCSISLHSPWPFLGCESCIYAVYYSQQSREIFFLVFFSSYLPCTKVFLSIFLPTRTILKDNLPSIVHAAQLCIQTGAICKFRCCTFNLFTCIVNEKLEFYQSQGRYLENGTHYPFCLTVSLFK